MPLQGKITFGVAFWIGQKMRKMSGDTQHGRARKDDVSVWLSPARTNASREGLFVTIQVNCAVETA
jgi:hypothetical protein